MRNIQAMSFSKKHIPMTVSHGIPIMVRNSSIIAEIIMAYLTVNDNIRDTQIKTFIAKEVASEKVSAVSYAFKDGLLTVDLIGTPLTEDQVAELQASMQSYSKLTDAKLHIVQGNVNTIGQKKIQQIITNRIEGLVANDKGKSYKELASLYYPAYQTQQSDEQITVAMNAQLPALFPQIVAAQGSTMVLLVCSNLNIPLPNRP